MRNGWHIVGGRILDPTTGRDETTDLYVDNGALVASLPRSAERIDARGLTVVPGLTDLHVHFREPGNDEAETIDSGSRAAARGGFTSVVTMPNTTPAVDTPETIAWQIERSRAAGRVRLLPAGCITRGRQGKELADLAGMKEAGAVAFTDDGSTVSSDALMEKAMALAQRLEVPILDHAVDPVLAGRGVMHEGSASARLGLPGISSEAEVRTVRRDIDLATRTGCAIHIQHVSARESLELIREARAKGIRVSGEATPHHLALCDADVRADDANFKMAPPIRSAADRDALLAAVADGALQVLATDHAPHRQTDKAKGFLDAPFGVIGLETAVGLTYTLLVQIGRMPVMDWLHRWTVGPARVLGGESPSLEPGRPADLAILDLSTEWTPDPAAFLSRSRNTPFGGRPLIGRAVCTLLHGQLAWDGRK